MSCTAMLSCRHTIETPTEHTYIHECEQDNVGIYVTDNGAHDKPKLECNNVLPYHDGHSSNHEMCLIYFCHLFLPLRCHILHAAC